MNNLLPIGSVIILRNVEGHIMIIGFNAQNTINEKKYDYVGCPLPMGVENNKSYICFDKEEIENILFVGYQSSQFLKSRNIIEKAKESED